MKNATYAALALGLLVLGPTAATATSGATMSKHLLDLTMETQDACGSGLAHVGEGLWSYNIAGLDDPIPYAAAWVWTPYYNLRDTSHGPGCFLVAWTCTIQVSDGSHFEAFYSTSTTLVTGEYKGVAVAGGDIGCRGWGASLRTFIAGVVPLTGHNGYTFPVL